MAWYNFWKKGPSPGLESMAKGIATEKERLPALESWDINPSDLRASYSEIEVGQSSHPGTAGLDFQTLRSMARVPVISAIIQTRINQVAEFATPCKDPYSIGYRIRLRDADEQPTPKQKKEMRELSRWVQTCGDPRIPGATNFEHFLRMVLRDSLIFDQACFEVVKTKGGNVAGFVAVDASTIRRAKATEPERRKGRRNATSNSFVQVLNNKVVAKFDDDELCFGIRRPRSWMSVSGYGYPELEELINVVTNLVNAESFNAANFTHGMHVAGILAVKSKMNPSLFRSFRREFYAMLSGAHNAKKTPIIQLDPENKEELQSVNMSNNNKDMEFSQWISWLLKISCTIYSMDPAEISFVYGSEGQSHSLNEKSPMDRVLASKERGLRPLIRSVERWMNEFIIQKAYPDYCIEFAGFDARTEDAKLEFDIKTVKSFRTINEVRAIYDLKPIDSPVADMILDPTYINTAWQMSVAAEGEEGGEGEEAASPPGGGFDLDSIMGGGGYGGDEEELDQEIEKALRQVSVEVME